MERVEKGGNGIKGAAREVHYQVWSPLSSSVISFAALAPAGREIATNWTRLEKGSCGMVFSSN